MSTQLIWNFNGQDGLKTAVLGISRICPNGSGNDTKIEFNKTSPLSCEAFIVVEMKWVKN